MNVLKHKLYEVETAVCFLPSEDLDLMTQGVSHPNKVGIAAMDSTL